MKQKRYTYIKKHIKKGIALMVKPIILMEPELELLSSKYFIGAGAGAGAF